MWSQVVDKPVFAVAGSWQRTAKGLGFAMVTSDPNGLVAPIHRMAMITILHPDDDARWFASSCDDVLVLQHPYDAAAMTMRGAVFPTHGAMS